MHTYTFYTETPNSNNALKSKQNTVFIQINSGIKYLHFECESLVLSSNDTLNVRYTTNTHTQYDNIILHYMCSECAHNRVDKCTCVLGNSYFTYIQYRSQKRKRY